MYDVNHLRHLQAVVRIKEIRAESGDETHQR